MFNYSDYKEELYAFKWIEFNLYNFGNLVTIEKSNERGFLKEFLPVFIKNYKNCCLKFYPTFHKLQIPLYKFL